jgi:hypothetical protein
MCLSIFPSKPVLLKITGISSQPLYLSVLRPSVTMSNELVLSRNLAAVDPFSFMGSSISSAPSGV